MHEALGQSEAFLAFTEQLSRVARVDRPVLLIGERGSGKELAAAKLHYLSGRWEAPLVALNCAALAPALIEAELFGHERGAFTGALAERAGRFEAADGGTLLLDEIGLIPIEAQEKILRAVEYGSFERVGSSRPTSVDVRIIGATNADLPALARDGRFKEDLLDRLSFEVLHVPPRGRATPALPRPARSATPWPAWRSTCCGGRSPSAATTSGGRPSGWASPTTSSAACTASTPRPLPPTKAAPVQR